MRLRVAAAEVGGHPDVGDGGADARYGGETARQLGTDARTLAEDWLRPWPERSMKSARSRELASVAGALMVDRTNS